MTILEVLESTTKYFIKHGVASPRLTIELMLAEILSKTRMQLYMEFGQELTPATLDRLRPLVKRRADGEPLEYVLGVTTFAGRRMSVTTDTLIPRTDTELLVEAVLEILAPKPLPEGAAADNVPAETPLPIIDIGTGSGAIACAVAQHFPSQPIYAVDVSPAALAIAQKNGQEFCNITFLESDLLSNPSLPNRFHLIVANLPYIPSETISTLAREVRCEPKLALDGGADGLDIIKRLIDQSVKKTTWLALEFGDGQTEMLKSLCQNAGYNVCRVVQDFTQRDRILVAQYHG